MSKFEYATSYLVVGEEMLKRYLKSQGLPDNGERTRHQQTYWASIANHYGWSNVEQIPDDYDHDLDSFRTSPFAKQKNLIDYSKPR